MDAEELTQDLGLGPEVPSQPEIRTDLEELRLRRGHDASSRARARAQPESVYSRQMKLLTSFFRHS
jgi:hypothetical protein